MNKPVLIILLTILITACGLLGGDDEPAIEPVCTNSVIGEWTYLGLEGESVRSIAIHPEDHSRILAGTSHNFSDGRQGKIFKTTDCGETWQLVWEGGSITALAYDLENPEIVYASPHGMIRSMDGGQNWTIIDNGLEDHLNFQTRVLTIAVDPVDTERVYIGTGGFHGGGLFVTDDRGEQWRDDANLRSNIWRIALNPFNNHEIWVGVSRLLRSEDRGENWQGIDSPGLIKNIIKFNEYTENLYVSASVRRGDTFYERLFVKRIGETIWRQIRLPDSVTNESIPLHELEFIGSNTPILATSKGIFVNTRGNWVEKNENFPSFPGAAALVTKNGFHFYAGMIEADTYDDSGGIYVRDFSNKIFFNKNF